MGPTEEEEEEEEAIRHALHSNWYSKQEHY